MSTKPYYGTSNKIPKGHHAASMIEAAKAKQVRRWGLYTIDPRLLAAKFSVVGSTPAQYRAKVFGLKGKVAKLGNQYKRAKLLATKQQLAVEYKKAVEELRQAAAEYETILSSPTKLDIVVTPDPKKQPGYYKKQAELKSARAEAKLKKEQDIKERAAERIRKKNERERLKHEKRLERKEKAAQPKQPKKVVKKTIQKTPVKNAATKKTPTKKRTVANTLF